MPLIKQVWLLLVITIVTAFMASFGMSLMSMLGYVETQLRLKNSDNAQSLALTLSQLKGDTVAMQLALAAQFDTGHYESIRLEAVDGRYLVAHRATTRPEGVPSWFVAMLPIRSVTGVAQVSDGWKSLGVLHVVSHTGFAYRDLWHNTARTAGLLTLLSLLAGWVARRVVRRLQRPLDATVEQAKALVERRFVTIETPPAIPELARLTEAMNAMVSHVRAMFEEQATQAERLRRDATCDPLTGLSHRRHFLSQLQSELETDGGATLSEALVLIRIMHLADLNRTVGYQRTDELLLNLSRRLSLFSGPSQRIGRLNGSDFAVCINLQDGAVSTMLSGLMSNLRNLLAEFGTVAGDQGLAVCGACASLAGYTTASALLTDLDAALARAESRGEFAVEQVGTRPDLNVSYNWGTEVWRGHLLESLTPGRAQLVEYRLMDARGGLIHHECPLRLELVPGEGPCPAAVWLPYALRAELMPTVDLTAVNLALAAIEKDGQPRGVNISPASLQDSAFIPSLRLAVESHLGAAYMLWLEVAESAMATDQGKVRELCAQMQMLGVKVGLEHAGPRLSSLDGLLELGLSYVKLDTPLTQGMAADSTQAHYVASVVRMLRGVGLSVFAEGVCDAADAQALWACGVDGITGPWVG